MLLGNERWYALLGRTRKYFAVHLCVGARNLAIESDRFLNGR